MLSIQVLSLFLLLQSLTGISQVLSHSCHTHFETGSHLVSHSHTFCYQDSTSAQGLLDPPISQCHWLITPIGHNPDPSLQIPI